jgi:hypothetical protein
MGVVPKRGLSKIQGGFDGSHGKYRYAVNGSAYVSCLWVILGIQVLIC